MSIIQVHHSWMTRLLMFFRSVMITLGFHSSSPETLQALHPHHYRSLTLHEKTQVNHNTWKFRLQLPRGQRVDLPIGQHLFLRGKDAEGKIVARAYTPVSAGDEHNFVDLLIKLYPQGKMSSYLKTLNVGDTIEVRGPAGHLHYKGHGKFIIHTKTNGMIEKHVHHVGMIAGGSGITPMLQMARALQKDRADPLEMRLLFGNQTVDDVLLRQELDELHETLPNFKVHYTVDKAPENGVEWKHSVGFVTPEMIKKHLPPPSEDTLILLCGPKPMTDFMMKHLMALEYTEEMVFVY